MRESAEVIDHIQEGTKSQQAEILDLAALSEGPKAQLDRDEAHGRSQVDPKNEDAVPRERAQLKATQWASSAAKL